MSVVLQHPDILVDGLVRAMAIGACCQGRGNRHRTVSPNINFSYCRSDVWHLFHEIWLAANIIPLLLPPFSSSWTSIGPSSCTHRPQCVPWKGGHIRRYYNNWGQIDRSSPSDGSNKARGGAQCRSRSSNLIQLAIVTHSTSYLHQLMFDANLLRAGEHSSTHCP